MTTPVTRRSLLVGTAVSVVGGVVGFVVARNSDAADKAPAGTRGNGYGSAPGPVLFAAEAKVPQSGGIILGSQKVVLTKDASGTVHAFSSICPHQGCPVNKVSDGTISCPCHGSQFDAGTGAVVQGPATTGLSAVPITIKNGNVYGAGG